MKRNVIVVALSVTIASGLSGCGPAFKITHDRSGGVETVSVVGTQAVLLGHEKLIDKTWNTASKACLPRGGAGGVLGMGAMSATTAISALAEFLSSARAVADQGVGLVNLFGSHSYAVTLKCNPGEQQEGS